MRLRIIQFVEGLEVLRGTHSIRFNGTCFWVLHRRKEFGPFDYEWSKDFSGVEFMYSGHKFGEYCSADEIFADLKQFSLPMSVVEVASLTIGTVLYGVLNGLREPLWKELLRQRLDASGFQHFSIREDGPERLTG
ncbi:hypothetical protein [Gimesia aquarii]|uniref:Uncharacterized protein n=1 Tax=Gimesia aquarii TaxID=2527964 RepID=A0A517VZB1_9PLAN|nr:hypothetical protein [Gimesia aquarii]QDT98345.1 hypothetical protein V144x_38310 [Gimesia aquarii]